MKTYRISGYWPDDLQPFLMTVEADSPDQARAEAIECAVATNTPLLGYPIRPIITNIEGIAKDGD